MQNALANLEMETARYKGYPEEELQRLLDTLCKPEAAKRRDNAVAVMNNWRTCLDAEAKEWERVCDILGLFMMNLCEVHMDHRVKSESNKNGERFMLYPIH